MTLNTGWTEKETKLLQSLWAKGYSASRCAEEIKRSRNSIISKVHRMGLTDHGEVKRRKPRKKPLKSTRNTTEGLKDKFYYNPTISQTPINKEPFQAKDHIPVSLDDLTTQSCRWPLDDVDGNHVGYCGCKKTGIAYCDHHAQIAYPILRQLKNQEQEVA